MLQYYCYLNLAVAVVLAYRPPNRAQYRHHGVEDKSHGLSILDLDSEVVRLKQKGAIPLFHSLISGEDLGERGFQLDELAACIPSVSYELTNLFGLKNQLIHVSEIVVRDDTTGRFHSQITFHCKSEEGSTEKIERAKVERAMPDLKTGYTLTEGEGGTLSYRSQKGCQEKGEALTAHRSTCMRLVNYGGHLVNDRLTEPSLEYFWIGIPEKPLLPTLTATLLLSFGMASICRYRPGLARRIEGSEINSLLDVIVSEADAIVIPAMRNLLYRQEVVIGSHLA